MKFGRSYKGKRRFFLHQIPIALEDQEKITFIYPFEIFAYRRMPFGLCNAPSTFQRCMVSIFSDMIERFLKIFMDDFSIFGSTFSEYLNHLRLVLERCKEKYLVLNWKKYQFMIKEDIILDHVISKKRIEVDKVKVDLIVNLSKPKSVKEIRSFLRHASFYRRFIKNLSLLSASILLSILKRHWHLHPSFIHLIGLNPSNSCVMHQIMPSELF